jgi:predicted nucleic acid-binding protein
VGGLGAWRTFHPEAQAEGRMSGVTLDAGGLIALDRNDRRIIALIARADELGARVSVPATALAQAIRTPAKQARLSRLIRQPTTAIVALDGPDATQVGVLLAASQTTDIADAHVVICARRHAEPIVTSDPDDLRRLDPSVRLIAI